VKSAVETLGPTRVKLTVEVPFDELRPAVNAAYKKIGQQVRLKGFRPGKVPQQLIDRQVGRAAVLEEAVNEALPHFYGDAVRANDVRALGHPEVAVTEFADGAQLVFTAEVDVRPVLELPSYDGLDVVIDPAEPADAEVDEQLGSMRERFATLSTVERPAGTGDYVLLDLATVAGGEPVEDASATGLSYEVGGGGLMDGLDAAVTGLAAGGEARFETKLRDAEAAEVTATVRSVKEKQLPELDDDFARTASEFDTLAELREDVRARVGRVRRLQQGIQARDLVLEKLLGLVEVPIPEHVLTDEVEIRRSSVDRRLESAGLSMAEYLAADGRTSEEFDAELDTSSRVAIKTQLVLDEVARREDLSVSEAELTDQLIRRAARMGISADEYARELVGQGQLPVLMSETLRAKALAFVLEHAKITDTEGREIDLDELASQAASPATSPATSPDTSPATSPATSPVTP